MTTYVKKPDKQTISEAAELLKSSEIVGMPTETVYGLAANAYDVEAVRKIFLAKGRPQDNPLILHISNLKMLREIAAEIPEIALELADAFWPGPLTMIFPKKDAVPRETTGGLDTAAVRMPDNEAALSLIERCGFPIAAPSANLSGSPSPTTAQHVLRDMDGKIPLILDAGACRCGVESTVICFTSKGVKVLRPGVITVEMLREHTAVEVDNAVLHKLTEGTKALSPGMKYKHYSPKAKVSIAISNSDEAVITYAKAHNAAAVVYGASGENVYSYGETSEEQASRLFAMLRELDDIGVTTVYVRAPSSRGVGLAVYNRLLRAAAFDEVEVD